MGTPPPIEMANLGMADSLILMVLALVVFGPRRLPQIGRQIGKLMYEFRKASNDFKYQMEEELRNAEEADRRKKEEERLRALALAAPAQTVESVTQVSESNPEAPTSVANGESAVTSPCPGEIEYPAGASAAVSETPVEEPYPRIQPPSTGEQVQAAAPSVPAAAPAADPAAIPEAGEAQEQAQEQQPSAATEPVANHG
jgi:sec-independent protein translocase protein TatB